MSKKYLIVITLLAALYVAKQFYSKNKLTESLGDATATKNGVAWSARCSAKPTYFSEKTIDVSIVAFDNEKNLKESLTFFNVPLGTGKYLLSAQAKMHTEDSLSGACYSDSYKFDMLNFYKITQNDTDNYVEITSYDAEKSTIQGRFNLTLWHPVNTPLSADAPDSLVVSEGVFKGRIENRPRRVGQNGE